MQVVNRQSLTVREFPDVKEIALPSKVEFISENEHEMNEVDSEGV